MQRNRKRTAENERLLAACEAQLTKIQNASFSDLHGILCKELLKENIDFWYLLGAEAGGPLYLGLYRWLAEKLRGAKKTWFFLAPGGYNLYHLLKERGFGSIKYLELPADALHQAQPEEEQKKRIASCLDEVGFWKADACVFDSGRNGRLQYLTEQLRTATGRKTNHFFSYLGIVNQEESRRWLHGKHYETYAFDFYTNYSLQNGITEASDLCDLFFSAPNAGAGCAKDIQELSGGSQGEKERAAILAGIEDYCQIAIPLTEKFGLELTPETAIEPLQRLILCPTEDEVQKIGSLLPDSFCAKWRERAVIKENENSAQSGPSDYHLENEQSIRNYQRWLRCQRSGLPYKNLEYQPGFSVVIPVYNTADDQLREAIDSVLGQTYENFELILVDDHSSWANVVPTLQSYETNPRVQVIYRKANGHISEATNDGIRRAKGDFIAFMDCDDTIEPDALYAMALKLNEDPELDFIYSDEDKLTEDGKIRHMPSFKPDWSPDLFWCIMYTNHLAVYRRSIVEEVGGLRSEYNGSQDYDLTLRFMEKSDNKKVGHIPRVLYHWRERRESAAFAVSAKSYATEAARLAKLDALRRRKISGHLEYIPGMAQYRPVYDLEKEPLVSIVIPSKDHPEILRQCIESVIGFTLYRNYEIIVVDNGSNPANKQEIEQYLAAHGVTYIYGSYPFNFSKMCNLGAEASNGEYVLFLNDDVEVIQPDWLTRMAGQAVQPHTGAVGAKLLYPETTIIQHAGVFTKRDGPDHHFVMSDDQNPHYFGYNWLNLDCIAVTGACLLVSREIFNAVGGFDESLPIAYNDVELCFRIYKAGYYNVVRNDAVAYHHESLSRGTDLMTEAKLQRIGRERLSLFRKYPEFCDTDPFLNRNLFRYGEILDLRAKYDLPQPCDVSDMAEGGAGFIDHINITDKIQVIGWSCLPERSDNRDVERQLVLTDPYGCQYRAPVSTMSRPDVVKNMHSKDLLYSGFECVLDLKTVRMDLFQYQMGIQMTAPDGSQWYYRTETKSPLIRSLQPGWMYDDSEKLHSFELHDSGKQASWSLDSCTETEDGFLIKGWAFCDGNNHYRYQKQIILADRAGDAYRFDVTETERPDVAMAFPELHFLWKTGFQCRIYRGQLPAGKQFEIVIRLWNLFDAEDTKDVVTGKILVC